MESTDHSTSQTPVRVLVVNDSPIFLDALKRFLLDEPWIKEVGTAIVDTDLDEKLATAQPDIIVLDPGVGRSVVELIGRLRARVPKAGIVILMLEAGYVTPDLALEAGADAFVAKGQASADLLEALRRSARRF
jgi:DNA-binding NarL/FixJ family response regulator